MVDMYKQVADATAFVRGDGSRLHSLKALELALLTMSQEEYNHHVASGRNDFANWVEHVFLNKDLASKMRKSNTKLELLTVLENAGKGKVEHDPIQKMIESKHIPELKIAPPQKTEAPKVNVSNADSTKPLHHKLKGIFKKSVTSSVIETEKKSEKPAVSSNVHHHSIDAQIDHLDRELAHLTRHHAHTTARTNVGSASLEDTVQERILDFSLGLVVGLMLGFVLAKSFGL